MRNWKLAECKKTSILVCDDVYKNAAKTVSVTQIEKGFWKTDECGGNMEKTKNLQEGKRRTV
jgi:hypothetical protein